MKRELIECTPITQGNPLAPVVLALSVLLIIAIGNGIERRLVDAIACEVTQ